MICISLFILESLKENFHTVWVFFPVPGGYIPNKLSHGVETQLFPIVLILSGLWQTPLTHTHPAAVGRAQGPPGLCLTARVGGV
jgi:hypothetical protein